MSFEGRQYLRRLGVFHCEITNQGKRFSKQGVEQFFVTFAEIKSGDSIDAVFKLQGGKPINDFQKKEIERIKQAAGVQKAADLVGKQVAVFVAPHEWQGKLMWNAKGYYDIKYYFGEDATASIDEDFGESAPAAPADDFNF